MTICLKLIETPHLPSDEHASHAFSGVATPGGAAP